MSVAGGRKASEIVGVHGAVRGYELWGNLQRQRRLNITTKAEHYQQITTPSHLHAMFDILFRAALRADLPKRTPKQGLIYPRVYRQRRRVLVATLFNRFSFQIMPTRNGTDQVLYGAFRLTGRA